MGTNLEHSPSLQILKQLVEKAEADQYLCIIKKKNQSILIKQYNVINKEIKNYMSYQINQVGHLLSNSLYSNKTNRKQTNKKRNRQK